MRRIIGVCYFYNPPEHSYSGGGGYSPKRLTSRQIAKSALRNAIKAIKAVKKAEEEELSAAREALESKNKADEAVKIAQGDTENQSLALTAVRRQRDAEELMKVAVAKAAASSQARQTAEKAEAEALEAAQKAIQEEMDEAKSNVSLLLRKVESAQKDYEAAETKLAQVSADDLVEHIRNVLQEARSGISCKDEL